MRRLRKFFRLPAHRRALLVEAALLLAAAEITIRVEKKSRLTRRLGRPKAETPDEMPPEHLQKARAVSWAVGVASHHLPWKPVCLPQALAARWMLRRRHVESTLYLGLSRTEGLTAHAWLRVGRCIVTGRDGMPGYTVVSTFA